MNSDVRRQVGSASRATSTHKIDGYGPRNAAVVLFAHPSSSSCRCAGADLRRGCFPSAPHRSRDSVSLVLSLPMIRSRVVRWQVFSSPYSPTAPAFVYKIQYTSAISLLAKTSTPSGYGRCHHVFFSFFYPTLQGCSDPFGSHDFFRRYKQNDYFFSVGHVSILLPLDASSLRIPLVPVFFF
jgi:hypothetical protein